MAAQSLSKGTWVLAFTLVASFVGFIVYLSRIPLQPNNRVIETRTTPTLTTPENEQDLDQLDFYQLLKEQKVAIEATDTESRRSHATKSNQGGYILQAGSFSKKEDAEKLRATLLLEGFNATTEAVHVKGRQYHRVYVGPFKIQRQLNRAEKALAQLKLKPLIIKQ